MTENSSYYTISNVSEKLRIPPHVLRFWEKKFNFVKPKKSQPVEDITLIKILLT